MLKIKFLKAFNGDSILISYNEEENKRNILIDGGTPSTYVKKGTKGKPQFGELKVKIEEIRNKNEKIDLLILTHVDDDHIGGILKWFEKDKEALSLIKKIWFNSGRLIKEHFQENKHEEYDNSIDLNVNESTDTSIKQGAKFEDIIGVENGHWERKIIKATDELNDFGIQFRILSPNEEKLKKLLGKWEKEEPESLDTAKSKDDYDKSLREHFESDRFEEDEAIHNGSSISFILTFNKKNLLFLADAHPSVLVNSLMYFGYSKQKPLKAELVKISHHGSTHNSSKELLELIDSNKYIISTDGNKHSHPHKSFLARLVGLKGKCELYFNYPELIKSIFLKEDFIEFPRFKALSLKDTEIII